MAISWLGLSSDELIKRKDCLVDAWNRAQGRYVTDAIIAHTTKDFVGLVAGVITMVVGAAMVIIIGNVAGAAIGGALGSLAGGAGAVPGAAAGRALGNLIATGFLNVLGVGLLIAYIGSELGTIGYHFYVAIDCAWNSADFGNPYYTVRIDWAARHFAEGIGKFFGAMVMALIIVLTRRPAEERMKVFNSKLSQLCNGLEAYIARNLKPLEAKYKNGLAKATVTEGIPETPELGMKEQKKKAQAAAAAAKPFGDMPSFYRHKVTELQGWLKANGFTKKASVRKPGDAKPGGGTYSDFQSEIWMRDRGNGAIECVRIDPEGHLPPADPSKRTGPFRVTQDPATGKWSDERIAWGERPHYHLETITPDKAQVYLNTYVPEAKMFEAGGKSVGQMQDWHNSANEWAIKVYGEDGALAPLRGKFEMIHIPLAAP
ncbi:DUF6861 domain-containing protein [Paludibaculum fermentans]|uniref:NAD(+)--protein-arginine ADP-ribosyltransferase Tre1-like N-terminal domain-containing protein n=1 Tax=Paludibaculum fermentans TaxID=1473598 RepID=A0A7S7NRQ8_PALFE|nr:hypothetical protein [Paludibaculum fermentans]QOY88572.1 hypothetical protein IRI77_01005 [Paludibaculum fermentans]